MKSYVLSTTDKCRQKSKQRKTSLHTHGLYRSLYAVTSFFFERPSKDIKLTMDSFLILVQNKFASVMKTFWHLIYDLNYI